MTSSEGEVELQSHEISSTCYLSYRGNGRRNLSLDCEAPLSLSQSPLGHIVSHISPRRPLRPLPVHIPTLPRTYPRISCRQYVPAQTPILSRPRMGPVTTTKKLARVEASTQQAIVTVAVIFIVSLVALGYIYMKFPELEEHEKQHIKLPWDIEDAKQLGRVLDKYKERYFFEVLTAIVVTYIFLQTFAIPGSISLSILSGFLFPFPLALSLVCFCSATGASLCYLLSFFLGRRVVYRYFPERVAHWAAIVNKHRSNLFNYMLFLRMTPFLPNWFINIVSPVIDVPLFPFWAGTFLGVAPPSVVAIQAGQTLYNLSASSDTWSWFSVVILGLFAVLSLVPVLLKRQLRDKFE